MNHDRETATVPRAVWALWILLALFFCRVIAQVLVEFTGGDAFLPPSREWYSGLVPYPLLLPAQIVILALMLWINLSATRRRGFFTTPHSRLSGFLTIAAAIYAIGMLIRYFISGNMNPHRRYWPPGILPIVFHFVLAAYLFVLAGEIRRRA